MELHWDILLLVAIVLHIYLAPFTKVEESFNLQAVHDALVHGTDLASWDHLQFPGAVPRTFLGALFASALAWPAPGFFHCSGLALLTAVRLAVGICSWASHVRLRAVVSRTWGVPEARALGLLTALQFHLPFYMSRTLPNIFSLQLATLAHAELLGGCGYRCLALLGVAAAVFRCDLLVLIAPVGLLLLFQRRVTLFTAAFVTAGAAALGAAASVAIDSVLWQRWLWPEFEVLWFNTAENKSSDWGTHPALWYFYSALPRALLGALPLLVVGVLFERRARGPVAAALAFVALYSLLPHKELRFIFPAIPLLNAAAAAGAARCLRWKGLLKVLATLALLGLGVGTAFATAVMTVASSANYPGGVAMKGLHALEPPTSPALSVHIGNLAATSGVSRFSEERRDWRYSKEEGLSKDGLASRGFDRLLTEWPEVPGYRCVAAARGFETLAVQKWSWPPLSVVKVPRVFVLAKSADGATVPCSPENNYSDLEA